MALVTVQRSPSPSTDPDLDVGGSSEDASDGRSTLRKSLSESYFTIKGAALILPHTECTKKSTKKSHGGEIQNHLQAMLHLLRPEDSITIAVRLEETCQCHRYIALVSTRGRQDTEESVILGIDCSSVTAASIGLVLPIWMGLAIKFGGDGGFSVCTNEQSYLFKPTSVQAMWSAIQSLVKVFRIADDMKYIPEGLTHTWIGYYRARIDNRDSARMCQWNVEGVEVFAPSSLSINSETDRIKSDISYTLKEVMMTVDLDQATSVMLRKAVEEKLGETLTDFKSYFDEEVMRIVGQMDKPSKILEFLYLGSEWNASNLDELLEIGIGYILNVTKEIDNFFEGRFQYLNVRVYDVEESDLLKHWEKTYKFISEAREHNSKVLVHCQMGISRSASTVMAFIMKDERKTMDEAFQFVKECRSCVHPNSGFMEQLRTYEGILTASNKRDIFRCKSEQSLQEDSSKMEADSAPGFFFEDSPMLGRVDWYPASMSLTHESSLPKDDLYNFGMIHMETGLEAEESRSADSTDVLVDQSSPSPETTSMIYTFQAPSSSVAAAAASPTPSAASRPSATLATDVEMTNDQDVSSEVELCAAWTSSDGNSSSTHQASISNSSLRIKPDRSWIKLDTVEPEDNACISISIPINDSSICSPETDLYTLGSSKDSETSISHSEFYTLDASKASGTSISQSEEFKPTSSSLGESVVSSPNSLPLSPPQSARSCSLSPDKTADSRTNLSFYLGSLQNSVDIKSARSATSLSPNANQRHVTVFPQAQSFTMRELCSSQIRSSDAAVESASAGTVTPNSEVSLPKETPMGHATHQMPASQQADVLVEKVADCRSTALNRGEGDPKAEGGDPVTNNTSMRSSQSIIELGVRQYFYEENIPWKPGKVRKMQEDINKTGHISLDEGSDIDDGIMRDVKKHTVSYQEEIDEHSLLEHASECPPALSLCQSHSCMELCTLGDNDHTPKSVYEREEIPLMPGTVLRTRLEIEERQRLFCGDGDQDVLGLFRPVLRTSSLKQERGTPYSKSADCRRLTCGPALPPQTGRSLDNLQLVGVSSMSLSYLGSFPVSSTQMENNAHRHMAVDESSLFLHKARQNETPVEAGLVRKHKMELESKCEIDKVQSKSTIVQPESPITSHSSVAAASPSSLMQDIQHTMEADSGNTDRPSAGGNTDRPSAGGNTDRPSAGGNTDRPPAGGNTDSSKQPVATLSPCEGYSQGWQAVKGSLDSGTLALIREIGSAMLMSPTSPESKAAEDDEHCANMVKYFVRKIEKQMVVSSSTVTDSSQDKISSPVKDNLIKAKCSSLTDNSNTSGFQAFTKGTKLPDFVSVSPPSSVGINADTNRSLIREPVEIRADLTHRMSFNKCGLKSIKGLKDNISMNSSLKTESHVSLLLPELDQAIVGDHSVISTGRIQDQVTESTGSMLSSSCHSPSQGLGHESPESSVVRHLVGRFDNKPPELESHSSRDSHDVTLTPPPASTSHRTEAGNHIHSSTKQADAGNHIHLFAKQPAISQSHSFLRPVQTPSPPVSSFIAWTDPDTSSQAPSTLSTSSSLFPNRRHVSSDLTLNLPTVNETSPLTCDIPIELHEFSCGAMERPTSNSSYHSAGKLGPIPFTRSNMESLEKKMWRPVRPRSADHFQRSASYSEQEPSSSDMLQRRKMRESFTELDDDVSLRQVSGEGRKIRRLQGRSHPLTKLTEYNHRKGPFYSSM